MSVYEKTPVAGGGHQHPSSQDKDHGAAGKAQGKGGGREGTSGTELSSSDFSQSTPNLEGGQQQQRGHLRRGLLGTPPARGGGRALPQLWSYFWCASYTRA